MKNIVKSAIILTGLALNAQVFAQDTTHTESSAPMVAPKVDEKVKKVEDKAHKDSKKKMQGLGKAKSKAGAAVDKAHSDIKGEQAPK